MVKAVTLQATALSLRLGSREVLSGIDLQLESGELIGLIGPNGAGKSSLLRVLAGLQRPASGRLRLNDRDLFDWPAAERARRLAYLPQSAPLHWSLSVADVIALGRLPHGGGPGHSSPAHRLAVQRAAELADVAGLLQRDTGSLSGGERARVMLARLFAGEAPLLLADEPVAALDLQHQLLLMRMLRNHAQQGGAVLVVLHDLAMAARFCDRLLLLHQGTLLAQGSAPQVLTRTLLRQAFAVDAELYQRDGISQLRVELPKG